MDRKTEQADLVRKLGALLGPLETLVDCPERFDTHARSRVLARFFGEKDVIFQQMTAFAGGEPGHNYAIQSFKFHQALEGIANELYYKTDINAFRDALKQHTPLMQAAILEVPVEGVSGILEAKSPFTAYCRLQDICSTTLQTLIWTDPYFACSTFHRYLRNVRDAATITLVTLDPAGLKQAKDRQRHSEFMDISRLFAAEHGPSRYRLISHPDFHDRWLRCDGQIYALGGSVKDAGHKADFSIGLLGSAPETIQKVDDLAAAGRELFGPGNPTHP
jgi:hypothetical protein